MPASESSNPNSNWTNADISSGEIHLAFDDENAPLLKDQNDNNNDNRVSSKYPPRMHMGRVLCISVGQMICVEWVWAIEDTMVLPMMMDHGVSAAIGALIYLPVAVVCLLLNPYLGAVSDRCESRWGRRRPFILFFCMLTAGGMAVLTFAPDLIDLLTPHWGNTPSTIVVFFLAFLVSDAGADFLLGPLRALIGDLLPPDQLEEVNGSYGAYLVLGRAAALLIAALPVDQLAKQYGITWSQERIVMGFSVIVVILATICVLVAGKEKQYINPNKASNSLLGMSDMHGSINHVSGMEEDESVMTKLRNIPRRVVILLLMQFCGCAVLISQAWFWTVFIGPDVVFEGTHIHVAFLGLSLQSVVSFCLGAVLPRITDFFGTMRTYVGMMTMFSILLCAVYWPMSNVAVCIVTALMGCGFCVTDATIYVMMEEETVDCSERDRGFYMSLVANSLMFAVIFISPVAAVMLSFADDEVSLLFISSGIFGIVSLWGLALFDKFCGRTKEEERKRRDSRLITNILVDDDEN